jgi:zinc-binding alcohol dehydrogenase/oxidoreductase
MKAAILRELGGPEKYTTDDVPTPEPAAGEVRVRLNSSALNRRDYWMTIGRYPGMKLPTTAGSDGSGVIDKVGSFIPG